MVTILGATGCVDCKNLFHAGIEGLLVADESVPFWTEKGLTEGFFKL